MVERYRRGKRNTKQKLLGNHQKCWIWGRHAVVETLRADRWPILELAVADRLPSDELESVQNLASEREYPLTVEPVESLKRRCGSSEHQGYVAKMPPFPYANADTLLDAAKTTPLYLVLDSIQDPHNFGAIIRSAAALGVDAIFVAETGQSEVTSQVARSSAGMVNHVPIAQVVDLAVLLKSLEQRDVRIVATDVDAEQLLSDCDFLPPTALIVGNEGIGIRDDLLLLCHQRVRIPQSAFVGSLNAAVSAGIVLYEVSRQRAAQSSAR
jgi:23S rRNA (guanosine2251-2'-O)-methyltransferase